MGPVQAKVTGEEGEPPLSWTIESEQIICPSAAAVAPGGVVFWITVAVAVEREPSDGEFVRRTVFHEPQRKLERGVGADRAFDGERDGGSDDLPFPGRVRRR